MHSRALMRHIRETDDAHTVLMMQVENEVGVRGDTRDRSAAANAAFDAPIPKELSASLEKNGGILAPETRERWQAAGARDQRRLGIRFRLRSRNR